jgi:hypothetical protein
VKRSAWEPALCALLSALVSSACGGATLESRPLDRVIEIDGRSDDWHDSLTFLKKAGFAVGAFNDRQDLYLCINSWNEDVNLQIENMGWVLWFGPDRSHQKTFGIEFPPPHEKGTAEKTASAAGPDSEGRLVIRGPRLQDRTIVAASEVPGLVVRSSRLNGALTYELKIPLRRDAAQSYGIGADPGQTIETLFETNGVGVLRDTTRSGTTPHSGASGGAGGRGGGGGRMGGGGRGRRGGGGRTMGSEGQPAAPKIPKPLSVSVRLRLASRGQEEPARPSSQ